MSSFAGLEPLLRSASASATATLGFVATLFYLRDRGRKDLLLYALLAFGTAASQGLDLVPSGTISPLALARTQSSLAMLLPATGYLFLIRFLDLSITPVRRALLIVPSIGFLAAVLAPARVLSTLPLVAALVLTFCGVDLLWALWIEARRKRPDAPVLFLATAIFLFAALLEAATNRGILLLGTPSGLFLGPAFLVFTTLVLVVIADERERLLLRATTDTLTGVLNRTTFLMRAEREFERSSRSGEPLAVLMIDVDHFKAVNDRFGHPAGDRVLTGVGEAIRTTIRGIDLAGRYGGEEFVVLLAGGGETEAIVAAERIRAAIAALAPPRTATSVTASVGVAVHHAHFERAKIADMIARADAALYRAKSGGRNRVVVEEVLLPTDPTPADIRYR